MLLSPYQLDIHCLLAKNENFGRQAVSLLVRCILGRKSWYLRILVSTAAVLHLVRGIVYVHVFLLLIFQSKGAMRFRFLSLRKEAGKNNYAIRYNRFHLSGSTRYCRFMALNLPTEINFAKCEFCPNMRIVAKLPTCLYCRSFSLSSSH